MSIIDVPDYYRLAAENYSHVETLCGEVRAALDNADLFRFPFSREVARNCLKRHIDTIDLIRFEDMCSVVACIHGMHENDVLNDVVRKMCYRHKVVNIMGGVLTSPAYGLHKDLPLFEEVQALLRKFKEKTGRKN